MKIESLKPGMVVYDQHSHRMGNTTLRTWGTWQVQILSIDTERRKVLASWNGNPAQEFLEGTWSKWRLKPRLLIQSSMGYRRPATRAEIAAKKAVEE